MSHPILDDDAVFSAVTAQPQTADSIAKKLLGEGGTAKSVNPALYRMGASGRICSDARRPPGWYLPPLLTPNAFLASVPGVEQTCVQGGYQSTSQANWNPMMSQVGGPSSFQLADGSSLFSTQPFAQQPFQQQNAFQPSFQPSFQPQYQQPFQQPFQSQFQPSFQPSYQQPFQSQFQPSFNQMVQTSIQATTAQLPSVVHLNDQSVLDFITANPGSKPQAVARHFSCTRSQANNVLYRLQGRGSVERTTNDKGTDPRWYVKGTAPTPTQPQAQGIGMQSLSGSLPHIDSSTGTPIIDVFKQQ